jgi:hypothetical protein
VAIITNDSHRLEIRDLKSAVSVEFSLFHHRLIPSHQAVPLLARRQNPFNSPPALTPEFHTMKAVIRTYTFVATLAVGSSIKPSPASPSGPVVFGDGVLGNFVSSSASDEPRRAFKRASAIAISAQGPRKRVRFADDELFGRGVEETQTSRWEDGRPRIRKVQRLVSGALNNAVAKVSNSLAAVKLPKKTNSDGGQQDAQFLSRWEDEDWDAYGRGFKEVISGAFQSAVRTATPLTSKIMGRTRID